MNGPSPLPPLQPSKPDPDLTPQPMIRIPWVRWAPVPQPTFAGAALALYLALSGGMLVGCVVFTFSYLFGLVGDRCELCP